MRIKQNSLIAGILVGGMGMVAPENALSSTGVLIKDLVQFLQSETDFVTSHSPHSAIVKILVRTNDSRIECTGSVISRNKVLTAAHCVRDGKIGRWIGEAITVIPGLDGWHEEPYGRFKVTSMCEKGFRVDPTISNDVAVLTINPNSRGESIGDVVGWFGLSNHHRGRSIRAYADNVGAQDYAVCPTVHYTQSKIRHDCTLTHGMSGSPIYRFQDGRRWITGVNSYERDDWMYAIRLHGHLWDWVYDQVKDDLERPSKGPIDLSWVQ